MSRICKSHWLGIPLALCSTPILAESWEHKGQPAQIIELFTSEGCSSCPPADEYLSKLETHPELWQEVIPLAYHVDYWNYLGWSDKFASQAFSQKQRLYKAYGVVSSVYTPGFVVDGKEWRGYFNWLDRTLPSMQQTDKPALSLNRSDNTFKVNYEGDGDYIAHIVLLAMNQVTQVKAGENRGRELEHDFVVVYNGFQRGESSWEFDIDFSPLVVQPDAVAVWLTKPNSYQPEQTVAGWFNQ